MAYVVHSSINKSLMLPHIMIETQQAQILLSKPKKFARQEFYARATSNAVHYTAVHDS